MHGNVLDPRPGPVMVWTPEQAGIFLGYVADHDTELESMWHSFLKRGPRRGEIAGLGWTETHLQRFDQDEADPKRPTAAAHFEVVTQRTEVRRRAITRAPKSETSIRAVPLDGETAELLWIHKGRQEYRRQRLGGAWIESGRVYTKPDGSPLRPSWISERFPQLYRAAGLPPIRLHDARHTAATLMLAARVDMKVIQETLGHSAISTTMDIYASVLPDVAADAAEATAAIVPRSRPPKTPGHPSGTQVVHVTVSPTGGDTVT